MQYNSIFRIILLSLALFIPIQASSIHYRFAILVGSELQAIAPFIAQQRMKEFRGYPYLYSANIDEEYAYVDWFCSLPDAVAAVAYVDNQPVGFITGAPFIEFDQHFRSSIDVFIAAGLHPEDYFYFSEAIIEPGHRNQLLLITLSKLIEDHVSKLGYSKACFLEESHDQHPLKPNDYQELDSLWKSLGYTKTMLTFTFDWDTIQPDGS